MNKKDGGGCGWIEGGVSGRGVVSMGWEVGMGVLGLVVDSGHRPRAGERGGAIDGLFRRDGS